MLFKRNRGGDKGGRSARMNNPESGSDVVFDNTSTQSIRRTGVFLSLVACLMVGDLIFSIGTDSVPRNGNGYAHKTSVADARFAETLFGPERVLHNFLNFTHWWTAVPKNATSFRKLMSSDGNSALQNFFGHFILGAVLTIVACAFFPKPMWLFCAGTVVNIFHEYVAEGCYVDPSFIDLWLDQTALLSCMSLFFLFRHFHSSGKKEKSD